MESEKFTLKLAKILSQGYWGEEFKNPISCLLGLVIEKNYEAIAL